MLADFKEPSSSVCPSVVVVFPRPVFSGMANKYNGRIELFLRLKVDPLSSSSCLPFERKSCVKLRWIMLANKQPVVGTLGLSCKIYLKAVYKHHNPR